MGLLVTQAVHHVGGDPLEGARAEDPVVHSSICFAVLWEATLQVLDLMPLLVLRTWYKTHLRGEYMDHMSNKSLSNAQQ